MKVAIYKAENGLLSIVYPIDGRDITEIARKDVPFGVPYLIADEEDIPSDWSFAPAWEADFSNPHGIGMGAQRYFIAQAAAVIENPESTQEQIDAAVRLTEQMQREIIQMEGEPT